MDIKEKQISDLGLEYVKTPISNVRVHRTDGQWLVEYKKTPKWFQFWNYVWWWNDGKYVSYNDAIARAAKLVNQGYTLKTRYKEIKFNLTQTEQ